MRAPQLATPFVPGRPEQGYYNDLRPHLARYVPELDRYDEAVVALTQNDDRANPITVVQVGLGAWQASRDDTRWLDCVDAIATWLARRLESGDGALEYRFPLRGTYRIDPPWFSAMAQGEAASFLVRAAGALGRSELLAGAAAAVRPLVESLHGLVLDTSDGPVLEEYPTEPPSHVLNGWIFALWGLYDAGQPAVAAPGAIELFERSIAALAPRLAAYELPGGWSRYDLFPHPLPNVASPFYHRLHVAQLEAVAQLHADPRFEQTAKRWRRAAATPWVWLPAVGAKVAFRVVRPRRAGRGG